MAADMSQVRAAPRRADDPTGRPHLRRLEGPLVRDHRRPAAVRGARLSTGRSALDDGGRARPQAARRLARLDPSAMGVRLGGFVYGTIVVLSVLVAGVRAYPSDAGRIALLVVVTSLVFWVAHVYAHGISQSIADEDRLSLAELREIARHEGSIVEAAFPPSSRSSSGPSASSRRRRRSGSRSRSGSSCSSPRAS